MLVLLLLIFPVICTEIKSLLVWLH